MKWFAKRSRKNPPSVSSRYTYRPVLEGLEDRTLLSVTPATIASNLVHSAENFQNAVTRDYALFLNRAPSSGELAGWISGLTSGLAIQKVDAAIAASPEAVSLHGGVGTDWLQSLSKGFLGRSLDTSELNTLLDNIKAGVSTADIASGLATSLERDAIVIATDYLQLPG